MACFRFSIWYNRRQVLPAERNRIVKNNARRNRPQKGRQHMAEIVSQAVIGMIQFYERESDVRFHDINHFMKVLGFARTIGLAEGLDPDTQQTLELAAVAHDIACPLCRKKYGNTNGRAQETEGNLLTREFYRDFDLPEKQLDRICFIVAHHHTYTGVNGIDWQIMLEADFLVNADESQMSAGAIRSFRDRVFRTKTGTALLNQMYPSADAAAPKGTDF